MDHIFFFYFAAVIAGTSVLVVALRNPVYSALALLIMFFHVAGLYVTLHAEFLAAVQIVVYAGAQGLALPSTPASESERILADVGVRFHGERALPLLAAAGAHEALRVRLAAGDRHKRPVGVAGHRDRQA